MNPRNPARNATGCEADLFVRRKMNVSLSCPITCLAFSIAMLGLAHAQIKGGGLYGTASEDPSCQLNIGSLPILVTLTDQQGFPISGAHAALKRIQAGGYTKEDITAASSPQSDTLGQLVINYPTMPSPANSVPGEIQLRGAITIVAEGFNIAVVELSEQFPKPLGYLAASSAPWLKVTMIRAEQAVAPNRSLPPSQKPTPPVRDSKD